MKCKNGTSYHVWAIFKATRPASHKYHIKINLYQNWRVTRIPKHDIKSMGTVKWTMKQYYKERVTNHTKSGLESSHTIELLFAETLWALCICINNSTTSIQNIFTQQVSSRNLEPFFLIGSYLYRLLPISARIYFWKNIFFA